MKEIFKELDDLSALDLPIELRKILATYINSEVEGRVSSFISFNMLRRLNSKYIYERIKSV